MVCDRTKFQELYEMVYQDLYRYALCLLRNAHDAEDCVSEAVIAAYENIGRLRREEAFKSWIFTILANVCKKHLKQRSRLMVAEAETFEQLAAPAPDADLPLDVARAFAVLSEEEKMIIGLSVYAGYNSREIGACLRKKPSTVRSKRSRALAKLERVLTEKGE